MEQADPHAARVQAIAGAYARPEQASDPRLGAAPAARAPAPQIRGHDHQTAHHTPRAQARILLVAQPGAVDPGIVQRLLGEGHVVLHAESGERALGLFDLQRFDLVLLDALLPGISGFDTCRQLRARSDVAIVFLTAATSLPERLLGFDLGADDYVTTPAEYSELDRRIRAVLSRLRGASSRGGVELHGPAAVRMRPRAHEVFVGEQQLQLTPKEFALLQLLQLLLEHQGEVLSSDEISTEIWGYETFGSRNFVEAHISRLRRKLLDAGARDVVETLRGVGYAIRER